jgi:hypothetical protein
MIELSKFGKMNLQEGKHSVIAGILILFVLTIGDGVLQYFFNSGYSLTGIHWESIIVGAASATWGYIQLCVLKNSKGEIAKEPTKTEYKP